MYLVSIDEKVLPLPMGININKFSNCRIKSAYSKKQE